MNLLILSRVYCCSNKYLNKIYWKTEELDCINFTNYDVFPVDPVNCFAPRAEKPRGALVHGRANCIPLDTLTSFPIFGVIGRCQILCGGGGIGKPAARDTRPACCPTTGRTPPSIGIYKLYARKTAAIRERPGSNACDAVRNRDACKAAATEERRISNACDAVANRHACQPPAIIECRIPNARDAVANRHACQHAAITERLTPNAGNTVGNHDACKAAATGERTLPNACDAAIRQNNAFFTTCNQRLTLRFNDAVPRAVIDGIAACNCNTCKPAAKSERARPNARDSVGDRDACKAAATEERALPNACDAVGNRDACKIAAIGERPSSNACDAVGNRDICKTAAFQERILPNAGNTVGNRNPSKLAATTERIIRYCLCSILDFICA